MGWLDLPRVPEPEVMDESGEVEAYSSAAAQSYLGKIDDTFVDHALRLVGAQIAAGRHGRALDIGTGPGQIVRKLAAQLRCWQLVGVDRSPNMIHEATAALSEGLSGRVDFIIADANRLPFPDASFDLVACNSVLHHLENPPQLFAEIARVSMPDAAILLRDLRRPSRVAYPLHARWYGRHYLGTMYRLYCDSLRAAYTLDELSAMLRKSPLRDAHVFRCGRTHLGIERAAR